MARKKQKPLTVREIHFAERCFEHGNATRAYKEVGFPSVAERSIREMASRMRRKPAIDRYISGLSQTAQEAGLAAVKGEMLAFRTTLNARFTCS
jgi:hypothetical protein